MAEGTSFEIDLNVSGGNEADAAALAMARLADRLTVAESVAEQAATALKTGEASYRAMESAADKAAKTLEKVNLSVDAQREKLAKLAAAPNGVDSAAYQRGEQTLGRLVQRQTEMAAKAQTAKTALDAEAAALDRLKSASTAASAQQEKLTKAQTAAKTKADALQKSADASKGTGNLGKAASELGNLGGPLGAVSSKVLGLVDSFGDMKEAMGSGGPYLAVAVAVAAIVTSILAVTAAAVAGIAAVTQWAVALADAGRTQGLLSAGIAKSVAGGRALDAQLNEMQMRLPQTRDELASMASSLAATGLKGAALSEALEKAATDAARLKFGPEFEREMLSLNQQSKRLKAGIAGIFGGLQIEGLLTELSKMVGLFDQTTATGKAIKVVFESLFQPLIDGITGFVPKMVSAFIQFEILVLKALIAIKPFGSKIELVAKAVGVLVAVMAVMTAGFIAAVIVPFLIVAGIIGAVVAGITSLGYALYSVAKAAIDFGAGIMGSVSGALDWLRGLSLAEIGTSLISGLIAGITGAGGGVLSAITGIASGAINAAKSLLGIASPSKVFAEIGMQTGAGMAEGVDDGSKDVQSSLESMVAPPAAGAAPSVATASASSGGNTYYITVTAPSGEARSIVSMLRDTLAELGAQAGTAVPSA